MANDPLDFSNITGRVVSWVSNPSGSGYIHPNSLSEFNKDGAIGSREAWAKWGKVKLAEEAGGFICKACGLEGTSKTIHAHHVHPIATGGSFYKHNLILLCVPCHIAVHRIFGLEAPEMPLASVLEMIRESRNI